MNKMYEVKYMVKFDRTVEKAYIRGKNKKDVSNKFYSLMLTNNILSIEEF